MTIYIATAGTAKCCLRESTPIAIRRMPTRCAPCATPQTSISRMPMRHRRLVAAMGAVLTASVLLAPTVDPWYVCWLTPFVCLMRCPGAFLLTGSVMLSYAYYAGHVERASVLALEYAPVYVLLARQAYAVCRGAPRNG